MLSASDEFDKLVADNSNMLIKARLELADGTVREITGEDVAFGTPSFSEGTSSSSDFDIGACIMGKFNLSLINYDGRFDEYDFTGSTIEPSLGKELSDGTVEWIRKGLYHVDQPSTYGQIIALSSLDNMTLLERPYSDVGTSYPASLGVIVRDICNKCGVVLESGDFPCSSYVVSRRPSNDSLTCLAVLGYALEIACCYGKFGANGRLKIDWYNYKAFDQMESLDGGELDDASPYATGDTAEGGDFLDYSTGDRKDGGAFGRLPFKTISLISSVSVCTDDVVITGVSVTEQDDLSTDAGGTGNEGAKVKWGKDGYVLDLGDNPLVLYGQGPAVAKQVGERVVGMTFRPFESSSIGDPTLEAGDPVMVFDSAGRSYRSYVTSLTYKIGSYMSASCSAETPSRKSAAGYSALVKAIVDARNMTRTERTERQLAQDALAKELREASGLFMTTSKQSDGSVIYYLHDKATMHGSMIVWKMTATAIGISTDGGETYPYGLDVSGTAILDRVYAIGIDAQYLTTGRIADAAGHNWWDLETGEFRLSPAATVDGKEIATADAAVKSVDVEYAQNASNTQAPSAGWQTAAPLWSAGKYIWQRTKTVTQSGSVFYSQAVCISGRNGVDGAPGEAGADGKDGAPGKNGADGKDGKDAKPIYFHRAYAKSADGKEGFSTSYVVGSKYFGTYVDNTVADSSDPSKYDWALFVGKDGANGIPGKNGADGTTYYLHIAYATSGDGKENFSVDNPADKTYIGQCVDTSRADPTTPASYSWSFVKGDDGVGVSAVVEQYYLSTSDASPIGGSWGEQQPKWTNGTYIWTRSRVSWSDGSITYTDPCLAKAINGANEAAAAAQTVASDANSTVESLASDGVITQAERSAVATVLQSLDRAKAEATSDYQTMAKRTDALTGKSNTTTAGQPLSRLQLAFAKAYGPSSASAYSVLTSAINAVGECSTSAALSTAMTKYRKAYSDFSTAAASYSSVATECHSLIDLYDADAAATKSRDEWLTQDEVFNRLTRNGADQGIYMTSGKLYVNASVLGTGRIKNVNNTDTYWDLNSGFFRAKNIEASGSFTGGSKVTGNGMELTSGGTLVGYRNGSRYGSFASASDSYDIDNPSITYKGLQLTADGVIRYISPKAAVAASNEENCIAKYCSTGRMWAITTQSTNGSWTSDTTATLTSREIRFINGQCVNSTLQPL